MIYRPGQGGTQRLACLFASYSVPTIWSADVKWRWEERAADGLAFWKLTIWPLFIILFASPNVTETCRSCSRRIIWEILLHTYFSPKAFLQNSAASALVIRNVSPWNSPLGKMPFSSASIWLKIRDSFVRLRLQGHKSRLALKWETRCQSKLGGKRENRVCTQLLEDVFEHDSHLSLQTLMHNASDTSPHKPLDRYAWATSQKCNGKIRIPFQVTQKIGAQTRSQIPCSIFHLLVGYFSPSIVPGSKEVWGHSVMFNPYNEAKLVCLFFVSNHPDVAESRRERRRFGISQ